MKSLLESVAARARGTILAIVAHVDPEVLQWPGGSVVAMLLSTYATIAVVFAGQGKWLACAGRSGGGRSGTAL
jgi:hypothetical protein